MRKNRLTLLASAAVAALTLGPIAAGAAGRVPLKAAENGNRWFVELTGAPTADGNRLDAVRAEKAAFRKAAATAGIQLKERRAYDVLFNGLSVEVSALDRLKLSRLPGVKALYPGRVLHAEKVAKGPRGSAAALAAAVKSVGAAQAQAAGFTGTGIKVGVIDSGIDIDHPDFGGSGTPGTTAFPTARIAYGYDFVGDDYNADLGTEPVPDDNPDDCGGHGTHVAGIIGANGTLKGVAPDVTLGAYRVFGCAGTVNDDIVIAAMERAYADGMQVVNMSLGSAFAWPNGVEEAVANRLVKKGVVVVASAGNSGGSGLYSAGAPAQARDVISVGSFDAMTTALNQFTVSPDATPIGYNASDSPAPPTSGSSPMARTGTVASTTDACTPLAAGSLTGQTVLVRRGGCSFYQKSFNAQEAGATAVVLYNNVPGRLSATVAGVPAVTIPVVTISDTEGALIDSRLAAGAVTMTWRSDLGQFPVLTGGLISAFSAYGLSPDLSLKPDISGPGGLIYSTFPLEDGGFATLSGTSMSSPFVAGNAALVLQANPKVSARNMRDRLQNTADPHEWWGAPGAGFLEVAHRQGAGMVDVMGTIDASVRIQPGKLSLGESQAGPATRTLTLSNVGKEAVTFVMSHAPSLATGPNTFVPDFWDSYASVTFTPSTVTVPAKGEATVSVQITAPGDDILPDRSIYGGYLVATAQGSGTTYRVPYAGFKGDYQSIPVLTEGGNGFPWLAMLTTDGFLVNQPTGATYTMADINNVPWFLFHLDHQAQRVRLDVSKLGEGKPFYRVSNDDYWPRNAGATTFWTATWDGVAKGPNGPIVMPNGQYTMRIAVLKALGNPDNDADWETWASPTITVARP